MFKKVLSEVQIALKTPKLCKIKIEKNFKPYVGKIPPDSIMIINAGTHFHISQDI